MGQWQDEPFGADDQRATGRERPLRPQPSSAAPEQNASWAQPRRQFRQPGASSGNHPPSWLDDAPAPPFPESGPDLATRRVGTPLGPNAAPGSSLNISRSMRHAGGLGASGGAGGTRGARTLGDIPTVSVPRPDGRDSSDDRAALVPAEDRRALTSQRLVPGSALIPASARMVAVKKRSRPRYRHTLATTGFTLVALVLALIIAVSQSLQSQPPTTDANGNSQAQTRSTPPPSGSGPWTVTAGALIYLAPTPKPTAATTYASGAGNVNTLTDVEPCHGGELFLPAITQWTVPPGCYSNVFVPNPKDYPARAAQGYCNWWVEQNHLSNPNITQGGQVYLGTKPIAGAAVYFQGGVQGASAEGHWAQLVAVAPGGYWLLISEMNFAWRGAGFGRVDYRYVHVGSGVSFWK